MYSMNPILGLEQREQAVLYLQMVCGVYNWMPPVSIWYSRMGSDMVHNVVL